MIVMMGFPLHRGFLCPLRIPFEAFGAPVRWRFTFGNDQFGLLDCRWKMSSVIWMLTETFTRHKTTIKASQGSGIATLLVFLHQSSCYAAHSRPQGQDGDNKGMSRENSVDPRQFPTTFFGPSRGQSKVVEKLHRHGGDQ